MDPYNHLNFLMMSSKVALGGKKQIASAASPTHDLFIAALTN